MFSILVREVLGYDMSVLTLPSNNNNSNTNNMSDRDTQYQQLATCTTALYVGTQYYTIQILLSQV